MRSQRFYIKKVLILIAMQMYIKNIGYQSQLDIKKSKRKIAITRHLTPSRKGEETSKIEQIPTLLNTNSPFTFLPSLYVEEYSLDA